MMNNERSAFGRSSPRRRPGSAATIDSIAEDRQLDNMTPLPQWDESQQQQQQQQPSLDTSEGRQQRPSSSLRRDRDRTKHFDATTPTLIDEEDYLDDGYQQEAQVLDTAADDTAHRRTPGASMYRSVLEEQLRRTPGPEPVVMSQSSTVFVGTSAHVKGAVADKGLGFGLTLSTPVAAAPGTKTSSKFSATWQSMEAPVTPVSRQGLQKDGFSSQPGGSRERTPRNSSPDAARPGAFSPALLRLTEDIGNLLNEDEDDEYTVEIPVFRTDIARDLAGQEIPNNWVDAFAIDTNATLARRTTDDGVIMLPQRHRRKVGYVNTQQQRQTQLRNTQQPIPRRGNNDLFEFGVTRSADVQQAPPLLNFGGAFAPPAKDASIPFSRPFMLAAPAVENTQTQSTLGHMSPNQQQQQQQQQQHQPMFHHQQSQSLEHFAAGDQSVPSSQSFDTFSTSQRETPIAVYFQPHRFSSPSPTPSQAQFYPHSDMIATAQEYIPRSAQTGSVPPQYPPQMWFNPSPVSSIATHGYYDAPLHQPQIWHPSPPGFGSLHSSSFGDSRSAMTPSPHMPDFYQQTNPNSMYMMAMHPSHGPFVAPTPTHQQREVAGGERGTSTKKDGRKGKRVKKKMHKDAAAQTGGPLTRHHTPKALLNVKHEITVEPSGGEKKALTEEPVDSRRAELDESPAVRLAFKNFYKAYRTEEQRGVHEAEEFAKKVLLDESFPLSIHWRIHVELADLARRTNRFTEARLHYRRVCSLQPYASQGWVEYSKLEEECGNMNRVANIMYTGLEYCEYNENLMIRAIKHQERMDNHANVRALLARLKHVAIDKVWRALLEGALFEARVGNITIARRALKYVMHYVPWYGPLYVELFRLERDHGHTLDALEVAENGLLQIPRYSPLWFCAVRICEDLDHGDLNFDLPRASSMLQQAETHVSKEVIWKVYLEAAVLFERASWEQSERRGLPLDSLLTAARHYFALTICTCRLNLRWKVWLAGARMELSAGNIAIATRLFERAHDVAPEKLRSLTLLDYARLHEYTGEHDLARAILCKGRADCGHDWKIWLESILLEIRVLDNVRAYQLASCAIELHGGTGRLWSILVQLSQHVCGIDAQSIALRKALNAVPKSGEVWCEGARVHFNPFSKVFDADRARRHLLFAERFTPQYGDSFLESVRVELVQQWLHPIAELIWDMTKFSFKPQACADQNHCLTKYIMDVSLVISLARREPGNDITLFPGIAHASVIEPVRERLSVLATADSFDLHDIFLACSNADPNYGPLWFYCRQVQTDPPRKVMERAATLMLSEIQAFAHIYLAAQVRRRAIVSMTTNIDDARQKHNVSLELFDVVALEMEDITDTMLRSYPSLTEIYNPMDPTTGSALVETTIDGRDFVTGLMMFNKSIPLEDMTLLEKKRAIFATDALFT